MRMSCNGCRVLRKGCSENCTIRPCLQWIKTPDSQANATVFLAKFYGRAGLLNLINAGPPNLRPAIFRSLLYEACGRIVNPINGSVGLLWSGSWHLCQAAVDSVLKGAPIAPIAADNTHGPPFKPYDIRHVIKDDTSNPKLKTRCRLKRPGPAKPADQTAPAADRSISHDSTLSHHSELDGETESMVSAEARPLFRSDDDGRNQDVVEVGLELTLGLDSVGSGRPGGASQVVVPVKKRRLELGGMCEVALGLDAYGV